MVSAIKNVLTVLGVAISVFSPSVSFGSDINSGTQVGMISNPRLIVGRKVESSSQQIIRALFIFLTPPSTVNSQQSTVNSQQSTMTDGAGGIYIRGFVLTTLKVGQVPIVFHRPIPKAFKIKTGTVTYPMVNELKTRDF